MSESLANLSKGDTPIYPNGNTTIRIGEVVENGVVKPLYKTAFSDTLPSNSSKVVGNIANISKVYNISGTTIIANTYAQPLVFVYGNESRDAYVNVTNGDVSVRVVNNTSWANSPFTVYVEHTLT